MRTVYAIRDVQGEVIAEHVIVRQPDGSKRVHWRIPGCDPRDGLMGLSTPDLPLYGSHLTSRWSAGTTVLVCEGEKATRACWSLGLPALGTVTGAGSTPGEDALAVLLPFDAVFWADFDGAGEGHVESAAGGLVRLGGSARVMPRGYDKGDDAADIVERGGTRVTVERMVACALPFIPKPVAPRRAPRALYLDWDRDDRKQAAKSHLAEVAVQKLGHPKKQDRRSMWWPCPFHQDRTPSFKVDLVEPYYVCFGCGARGDVFTFLRDLENRDFKDALAELAPAPAIRTVTVWSL